MFSLEGRVALVTGSAQGIGRAIALNLAEGGARIALTDMRASQLDEDGSIGVFNVVAGNRYRSQFIP